MNPWYPPIVSGNGTAQPPKPASPWTPWLLIGVTGSALVWFLTREAKKIPSRF